MSGASEPLLPKSEPSSSYGALTPPPVVHMDTRGAHQAVLDTSDGNVFFCTTGLAGLAGLLCCPLTLLGMPTIVPPRTEAVGIVFGKYVGAWPLVRRLGGAARTLVAGGRTVARRSGGLHCRFLMLAFYCHRHLARAGPLLH